MPKKKNPSGKSPAVLWYPNDWLGSTMGMSFEERGAYFHVLMMQFNVGHMTTHMVGQAVGQLWGQIQHKFVQDDKGLWFNKRMEKEILARESYVKSRNNNALGNNQHSKNKENQEGHMGGHMTPHMENENTISSISNNVSINTGELEVKIKDTGGSEKKQFNKKPRFEDFNGYPDYKKPMLIEFAKITKQIDVSTEQIDAYWKMFKHQSLTGENFYNSESKVYEHFFNWFKKQDLNPSQSFLPKSTTTSMLIPKFSKADIDKYNDYQ